MTLEVKVISAKVEGGSLHIIYHCFGGTHSSVTAAGIHLGQLSTGKVPSAAELLKLPLFDRRDSCLIGAMVQAGTDRWSNKIYILGRGNRKKLLYNVVSSLFSLFEVESDSYLFIDVSMTVNYAMRLGGTLSRQLGLISWGRPLVAGGTLKTYNNIAAIVEKVLSALENCSNESKIKEQLSSTLPGVFF